MTPAVPPIGRASERAAAAAVLEGARSGRGALLLVEGEAGMGKSTLTAELTASAAASGFLALTASGIAFERSFPFGMVMRLLRSARVHGVERIAGHLEGVSPLGRDISFQVVEQVVQVLESAAARQPVLVLAEDVQWVDDLSVTTLSRLAELALHVPLVLVCTSRTAETRLTHVLERVDHPAVSRLVLQPLDEAAVLQLVSSSLGAAPGPNLQGKLRGAAGNPMYVLELVGHLHREGALVISDGSVEIRSSALPSSLRTMLLRRLDHLDDSVLEVLRTGAVLSSGLDGDELAAVLDRSQLEVLRCLQTARVEGVLVESERGLHFHHDLIREALYDDMPDVVRRLVHGQIARVLVERGAEPGRVVTHLLLGSGVGDTAAAQAMVDTAARLAAAAAPEAVTLLERVLEIVPAGSGLRQRAQADLAWIATWAGQPERGERLATGLLRADPGPEVRPRAARALVRALMLQGKFDDLRPQLGELLRDASLSPAARAELVAEAALMASGPPDQHDYAESLATEVLASDASQTGRCIALCALSYLRNFHGDVDASIEYAREALSVALSSRANEALLHAPHYYLAGSLMFVDELEEAEQLYRDGTQVAEQFGAPWSLAVFHMLWGHLHLYAGRWDDGVAELEAAARLADQLGTRLQIIPTLALLVTVSLHRGEPEIARGHLDAMTQLADSTPLSPYYVPWARAVYAHLTGDHATAQREAALLHRVLRATDHLFAYRVAGPDLVRIFLAHGEHEAAGEVARILAALVPGHPAVTPAATSLWAQAVVAADADMALAAVAEYRMGPRPIETAWAMEDAAVLLEPRDRESARDLLEQACATYADAGLRLDLRRAEATLRTWGVRRGRRSRHTRATSGWEALTTTELEVAALVAEGLSNPAAAQRMYISRRTVDAHLSHIYTKLGMVSRTQLAAEVVRRRAMDEGPSVAS